MNILGIDCVTPLPYLGKRGNAKTIELSPLELEEIIKVIYDRRTKQERSASNMVIYGEKVSENIFSFTEYKIEKVGEHIDHTPNEVCRMVLLTTTLHKMNNCKADDDYSRLSCSSCKRKEICMRLFYERILFNIRSMLDIHFIPE